MNHEVQGSGRRQRHDGTFYMYDSVGREVDCDPVWIYETGESWALPNTGLLRHELFKINADTGIRTRVIP